MINATHAPTTAGSVDPVARTERGDVVGFQRNGIAVFKGIRYGEAQRFEPSTLAQRWRDGWTDTLIADTYGAQCHQVAGLLERALGSGSLPSAEDCLFLNVFSPTTAPRADGSLRPVLVWVHGGAYTTGTAAMPWYDGTALVHRGDVVVVTINYRLGVWGYAGRSNLGSRDQVLALEWVRDHIAAFGGDPGNVTVFGESAGGSSLLALMAMPAADGLFRRALAMSPSITQLRSGAVADEALDRYLGLADAAHLDDLRGAPVDRLMAAQTEFLKDARMGFSGFSPTAESDSIPAASIIEAAASSPVPLVIGTTRDESMLWNAFNPTMSDVSDDELLRQTERRVADPSTAGRLLDEYRAARTDTTNAHLLAALMTDETFRRPAQRLADRRVAAGHPTWMYWFTWASTAFDGRLGSCHAMDIPFAFDNVDRKGVAAFTGDGSDRQSVADAFSTAVISFASEGHPGWPEFDAATRPTMRIDAESAVVGDPEGNVRTLWP